MFANSSVGINYRPDRKLLEAIAALATQVTALKARADTIPANAGRGRDYNDALGAGAFRWARWARAGC